MKYTDKFQQVIDFYRTTTPEQHQQFLSLIGDKLTFFNTETKECFDMDDEYFTDFNGIFHQLNIK